MPPTIFDDLPLYQGLLEEAHIANQTLVSGEAQRRMKKFLDLGAQTYAFERDELVEALTKLQAD